MSPLLFSLGLAAALDSISAPLRGLDGSSKVFAYLDDLVVVVSPGQVEAAHRVMALLSMLGRPAYGLGTRGPHSQPPSLANGGLS